MFSYRLIANFRNIFCSNFYLFEISIRYLNCLKGRLLDCLIISHCLNHRNIDSQTSLMLLFIFSFISNMLMSNNWLIICIIFLYWYILNRYLGLWTRLSLNQLYSIWGFYYRFYITNWTFMSFRLLCSMDTETVWLQCWIYTLWHKLL